MGDAALNPISYTGIYFSSTITAYAVSVGVGGLKAIDTRANNLGLERVITEAAIDRYVFLKNAYIQRRNYLVNDGIIQEEDVPDYYKKNVDNLGPVSPF
jgi:phospholipid-binding lipoprotein MlaA